jgi:hypothetical protein
MFHLRRKDNFKKYPNSFYSKVNVHMYIYKTHVSKIMEK